ncbi:MAG: TetR/AcrR family transcriptional regulator [Spirochaetota bacterium]
MDTKTLVQVGKALFARYGYRDVSIADIAREVGMSVGSFYNYFESKEAFYGALLDSIEEEGVKNANVVVRRLHSPMNKLKAVYRFSTLGLKNNVILRGVMLRDEKFLYPGIAGRSDRLRNHIEGLLREIILEGTSKGVFRTGLYQDPARMILAVFDTIVVRLDDPTVDVLIADILTLLQRGLRRALRLRRRDERVDRRNRRRSGETPL